MSVIDIGLAMKHLRAESEDTVDVQSKLDSAEDAAEQYMQRRIFIDDAALLTARTSVPTLRAQVRILLDAALLQAALIENIQDREMAECDAQTHYREALDEISRVARGLVLNKSITAACFLTLGHLWANREDSVTGINTSSVIELPHGSRSLLAPYRVEMGV